MRNQFEKAHTMNHLKTLTCRCFALSLLLLAHKPVFVSASSPDEGTRKPGVLVLYGPPGSGRAKLAVRLTQHFQVPKISFAELLANALHEDSLIGARSREYMNNGGDIPIDLFWMILNRRMKMKDCDHGCLWEGIPCTVEQTSVAVEKLSRDFQFMVFSIDASPEWLTKRVSGRFFCRSCGHVYNSQSRDQRTKEGGGIKPIHNDICDTCGHALSRRVEDSPETIETRHQTYQKSMSPVLNFWDQKKILKTVPGDDELETIYDNILKVAEPAFQPA